jgi:hypothetical protein
MADMLKYLRFLSKLRLRHHNQAYLKKKIIYFFAQVEKKLQTVTKNFFVKIDIRSQKNLQVLFFAEMHM